MLAASGLTVDALRNTPDFPLGDDPRDRLAEADETDGTHPGCIAEREVGAAGGGKGCHVGGEPDRVDTGIRPPLGSR